MYKRTANFPKESPRQILYIFRKMTLYKSSVKDLKPVDKTGIVVDLRSDTVTRPSEKMKERMIAAAVGDDVFQEDPTVHELEHRMAEIVGKEAGLFVTSGTMGNLLSILSHTGRRGSEILVGDRGHVFRSEQANFAQFGGVGISLVPTLENGCFCLKDLEFRVRKDDYHCPITQLLCLENPHGDMGGKVVPLEWIDKACEFAHKRNISVHMDGARIFNAAVYSGNSAARILKNVDSVSVCLSKGLGAPVGAVIVGNREFVQHARRLRKGLGGGWRQAGILAAAGLYALENNIERMVEDHEKAFYMALEINKVNSPNIYVKLKDIHTNMLFIYVNTDAITPVQFCTRLQENDSEKEKSLGQKISVLAFPQSENSIRIVTHLDVSMEHVKLSTEKIVSIIRNVDKSRV